MSYQISVLFAVDYVSKDGICDIIKSHGVGKVEEIDKREYDISVIIREADHPGEFLRDLFTAYPPEKMTLRNDQLDIKD
jgi:hypothetical protein